MIIMAWFGVVAGPLAALWLWQRGALITRTVVGLLTLAYGLAIWAVLIEPATLTVRQVAVESPQWSGAPLRIGVVSDLHIGPHHMSPGRVQRIVARLNAERPDVILFLGDFVGGHASEAERTAGDRAEVLDGVAALKLARAPLGVLAVLGNHDWWFAGRTIERTLETAGVQVLENAATRVARPGGDFWIAGLADPYSERVVPSAAVALNAVTKGEPVIVLSHFPDPFHTVPSRVALTLAGHSHCGQVNLPVLGRPILPSPGSVRWPCGLYEEDGRRLFVTGGVGTSILPVRFRAPPEIVIVTLRAPA